MDTEKRSVSSIITSMKAACTEVDKMCADDCYVEVNMMLIKIILTVPFDGACQIASISK